MDAGVRAREVTRSFGAVRALDGLDVTVPYGAVTALVGANGAGKTTLMLILATLLAPDSGSVEVGGHDALRDPVAARASLGWMPDVFGVYDMLTAEEYLVFFAEAYGLPKAEGVSRAHELLQRMGLAEWARRPVHVLSRGQKQRLGLARALVHRPKVLILDEPSSGLDLKSRVELRGLLRSLAADDGAAVLLSSHVMSELEIADRVVLIDGGRTRGEWDAAELLSGRRVPWLVRALDDQALAVALDRAGVPHSSASGAADVRIGPLTEEEAAGVLSGLVEAGVRVVSYTPAGGVLESAVLAAGAEDEPDEHGLVVDGAWRREEI
ncbi:ABC transporter ATP-binding protein [Actinocorallia sp. API 0066]|uniref:ABC transporter ATP-binding protein n=1 Tax=Actinocorallia sp. API 0066 TaxID=2896846 RepID=UPI001E39F853|nr:ABC transporter ATP-binding protein [Actinocorallia sp. API 0066]MCD0447642.1 ABC transporter ATP-binding protein [Actinocorallia sp. API 0066]